MFDRPEVGELAVLVHIIFPNQKDESAIDEFRELSIAAGAKPVAMITGSKNSPEPKYYIGSGKAEEIQQAVQATKAQLVLFNHELSPAQERNLEKLFQCRVLDRTGLILDIFAQRARTFEGKLQVELAQLQHIATRLVRGWTHLERQRGGIGLRGPGETQLETDRRLIRNRIKTIKKRLDKVKQTRSQGRRARQRSELETISVVGYTNAGKSTLFNRLSGADVFVADQPFATLDPTLRRVNLAEKKLIILADTVGFIRQLPHDLVDAFHATLEETQQAFLLLHVVDAHAPDRNERIVQVNKVLQEIEADDVPQLLVYNKIDLLDHIEPRLERNAEGLPEKVWLSAVTGEGVDLLKMALLELLEQDIIEKHIKLSAHEAKLRATLYRHGAVESETIDDDGGWDLKIRLSKVDYAKIFSAVKLKIVKKGI